MTAIQFKNATKSYSRGAQTVVAVDDISFGVPAGSCAALIGTSGSGKTTLLRMVNRMVDPDSGSVWVDGQNVREINPTALRRRIGYVPQSGGLFPHMTVAQNMSLVARSTGQDASINRPRVTELLELTGLVPTERFRDQYPHELSGGQRQRVSIARALFMQPKILLLDEAFSALDPMTRDQLHGLFLDIRERLVCTMLLVTHDMDEAFKLSDYIALLHRGRVEQAGTEAEFREQPATSFVANFLEQRFAT